MDSVGTGRPERLARIGRNLGPNGREFVWGPIDAVHAIGPYEIIEYREDKSDFTQESAWLSHGRVAFHPYIDGADTNTSYRSLDSALVGAIARRREGPNSQAAYYFDLMTGAGA